MATLSTAAQNAALQAIVNVLNTGATQAAPGIHLINTVPGFMILNGLLGAAPSFEVVSGVMQLISAPIELTLTGGGTVRAVVGMTVNTRGGLTTFALGVGTVGSGEDVELTTLSAIAGQKLRISAIDITIG